MAAIWLWAVIFAHCANAQEALLRQAARLDAEQKCGEAEPIYEAALAQSPASLAVLNNLGNHYVLCGDPEKARVYFERVLKLNPRHVNANLQLARLAADRHEGVRALEYLSKVDDPQPAVRMLRAEALHWAGRQAEALAALDILSKEAAADPRLEYLYGITCARVGDYNRAEAAFNALLAQQPDNFEILFNLGRAAARAGHNDRARHALEVASKLRPDDVETLLELGQVSAVLGDYARAIYILAQARKVAPARPEISLALAHAAQAGEYYGDAALAYDEYLRLRPADDSARRDRGLVYGFTDRRQAEGLKELVWYVQKHPDDPLGHYDLAQLAWRDHPQEAIDHLDRALRLDPRFAAAEVDLGWLLNRLGRTAEALPHFEKAVGIKPRDAQALNQLGSAYIAMDRPAEAEKVLRQAVAISPDDPEILMHLGRALMDSGHDEEGRQLLIRFQKNRPVRSRGPWRQPGMIESASLPPAERARREIDRLRDEVRTHADDPELQLRLASLLFAEGRVEESNSEFRSLLEKNADGRLWKQAGTFLLGFEQYSLAREFLERAAARDASANLELAQAVFALDGASNALAILDRVPQPQRSGDELLLKARILDAAGKTRDAEVVLEEGIRLAVSRPQIAREAALLLVRHNRKEEALALLARAGGGDPDLLLTRSMVLALMERRQDAETALRNIEAQWPEWDRPYLVHGLLLESGHPGEARRKIATALALGASDLAARCASARLASSPLPDAKCSCSAGIYDLLFPRCAQP
jgi:tetratricopeptide (TPR) repeat protein